MKIFYSTKSALLCCLLLAGTTTRAQHTISFDIAGIQNTVSKLNGLNVSCFYHFTEHLSAGIEMNRFFPADHKVGEETIRLSAWDFDLNIHYLLPITKSLKIYPLSGISHTSEKEYSPEMKEPVYERFWSFNTGAGLLYELGKWSPHIEYSYTWGHINQQFFLAGISYELEWGQKKTNPIHVN